MKQGTGVTTVSATKREPISHAVSEEYAAQIGLQTSNLKSEPMYEGRGIEAPKASHVIYPCGSQGKR